MHVLASWRAGVDWKAPTYTTVMKTDIINKTKQSFELKEGNAGAYRFLKHLDAGAKVSIKVDPNATYREYMVATGKKGETIFLTSDDVTEHKVIDIQEVPGQDPGTVIYKSVPCNPRKRGSSRASQPSHVGGAGSSKSKTEPAGANSAGVGSVPAVSNSPAAAVGSIPAVSPAAGVGSIPAASSSPPGAGSDAPAGLSVASSKPAFGISSQNERVPWYKKLKPRLK